MGEKQISTGEVAQISGLTIRGRYSIMIISGFFQHRDAQRADGVFTQKKI